MGDRARRAYLWTRHRAGVTGAYLLIVALMFAGFRESEHQRDNLHQSICNVAQSAANALFGITSPPVNEADRARRQKIRDAYEADLEAGTHCDVHLRPVPPPGG